LYTGPYLFITKGTSACPCTKATSGSPGGGLGTALAAGGGVEGEGGATPSKLDGSSPAGALGRGRRGESTGKPGGGKEGGAKRGKPGGANE